VGNNFNSGFLTIDPSKMERPDESLGGTRKYKKKMRKSKKKPRILKH
jgi:hypothetical protein